MIGLSCWKVAKWGAPWLLLSSLGLGSIFYSYSAQANPHLAEAKVTSQPTPAQHAQPVAQVAKEAKVAKPPVSHPVAPPTVTLNCQRTRGSELYLPAEFVCRQPEKLDWFGPYWTKNMENDPYQPACWKADNACAPLRCYSECQHPDILKIRSFWIPLNPKNASCKVLVFQYGKVASSSVVRGFKQSVQIEAAHAHAPEQASAWFKGLDTGISPNIQGYALSTGWSLFPGDRCFVITMTRSHFSRDPSEYFENIFLPAHPFGFHPRGKRRDKDTDPGPGESRWTKDSVLQLAESNLTALLADFHAQHPIVLGYFSTWWSMVFSQVTGVDVLKVPFDFAQKYSLVQSARCKALVLRFEDLEHWQEILGQFFPGFVLPKENLGSRKWYSEVYQKFTGALQYTQEDVDLICGTETERHFYREATSPCQKSSIRGSKKTDLERPDWRDNGFERRTDNIIKTYKDNITE